MLPSSVLDRRAWSLACLLILGSALAAAPGSRRHEKRLPSTMGGLLQYRGADLWIQGLDGRSARPLTTSGKVRSLQYAPVAAISPDGRRVAYIEADSNEVSSRGWDSLFVVNADGSGRRKLLDLNRAPKTDEIERATSFVWSDDGKQIAFVIEHWPLPRLTKGCQPVTLRTVDLATGSVTTALDALPLGSTSLLYWNTQSGEIALSNRCIYDGRNYSDRFTELRLRDGTVRQMGVAASPSLAPDGALVFLEPAVYETGDLTRSKVVLGKASRVYIAWFHRTRRVLVDLKQILGGVEGTSTTGSLELVDLPTGSHQDIRKNPDGLDLFSISPDDTHALVALFVGYAPQFMLGRGAVPLSQMYVVRIEDLMSDLPLDELRRRGAPLSEPLPERRFLGPFEYLGWIP